MVDFNNASQGDEYSQARYNAQKIAFAPVVFQVARVLRKSGILKFIKSSKIGLTFQEIDDQFSIGSYALKVLLETGLSANIIKKEDDKWKITMTGFFLLSDEMTRINMDFINDVCYEGLFYLDKSLENKKPEGYLKCFESGPDNIYDALETLPKQVQKSWFEFDHFYSDTAFPEVLPLVFNDNTKRIMDIGGNTGKWAKACTSHSFDVEVTIVDLPGQIRKAKANLSDHPGSDRVNYFEIEDIVAPGLELPKGFDTIWMSQFICCFSEENIVDILQKAKKALAPGGKIFILDTFWDKQKYDIASYCIINTSPYFSCIANGKGKMLSAEDVTKLFEIADLKIASETGIIGYSHTLYSLEKNS